MGGQPLSGCRIHIAFPIPAWRAKDRNWTVERVNAWVKNAGGRVLPNFDEQAKCTHVVVDEAKCRHNTMVVQQAFQANESGHKISIVSPQWLEECLEQQRKCREKSFSWEVIDQAAEKETKKLEKQNRKSGGRSSTGDEGAGEGEDGRSVSRAPQALIGEVFDQATDPFLGERDRRVLEAEAAGEERARKERKEAEAKAKEEARKIELQRRKERSDLMKKTVKKGRGDVFYENNNIFKDGTGFAYDITLTKVDTLTNTNERITLQIWESNKKPHTYVTNYHFAGTNKKPLHNVLDAQGSSMTTATRVFRKAFREQTGVSWDDRIKAHNERVRARQDREAESPGILSTRRGENGDIKSTTRADEDAVPFDKRKFEYMPPLHSAKGWLPDGRDEVPEAVRRMRAAVPNGRRDRTEQWMMSGDGGDGPEEGGLAPRESVEENGVAEQIDLTDDGPEDQQMDVSENVGGDVTFFGDALGAGMDAENTTAEALHVENFLAGLDEYAAQDNTFDMHGLSGQQQPEFNFDQTHSGLGGEQAGVHPSVFSAGGLFEADPSNAAGSFGQCEGDVKPAGEDESRPEPDASHDGGIQAAATDQFENLKAGGLGSLPFPYETQTGQTQLAAMVGQDLLNLEVQENAKRIAALESACGGDDGLDEDSAFQMVTGGMGAAKRKHDEVDEAGEDSAAKRFEAEFEGESFAT